MKEIILYIVAALLLLLFASFLNSWVNSRAEARCENMGGQFYHSIDAGKSLCKIKN